MKTAVKRRPFGKTGINVSEVAFGAMNLRMLDSVADCKKLINGILDRGINLIDTARVYNSRPDDVARIGEPVESELLLGEVIEARTDIDEPIVIVTKGHGYTPDAFHRDLSESLSRLRIRKENGKLFIGKTEIILCYLLHGISAGRWPSVESTGVLELAEKCRRDGDFHFLGFSSHYGDVDIIIKAINTGAFQMCELPYNVYNPTMGEEGKTDLLALAASKGMGIVNMKAYNGNGTAPIFAKLAGLTGIGYADMTRFCLSNPHVSTIDAGVRSLDEFDEDAAASFLPPMDETERIALREKAKAISPHLDSTCRECMHCVEKFECPQGIEFAHILGIHGRYTISQSLGFNTDDYKKQYAVYTPNAEECIKCGGCVEWCEYHLDVPALMERAAADLK